MSRTPLVDFYALAFDREQTIQFILIGSVRKTKNVRPAALTVNLVRPARCSKNIRTGSSLKNCQLVVPCCSNLLHLRCLFYSMHSSMWQFLVSSRTPVCLTDRSYFQEMTKNMKRIIVSDSHVRIYTLVGR